MEHPYLTTTVILLMIVSINNIVIQALNVFKKPSPTTLNLNVDSSDVDDILDRANEGDMN